MVEDKLINLSELKDLTKSFVNNNGDNSCNYCDGERNKTSSDNPNEAVVSLLNGKKTTYKQYIAVQNELTKAYYELRNTYRIDILKKTSDNLTAVELKKIKSAYPLILSEAETK